MRERTLYLVITLAFALAVPAQAQNAVDSCSGQPVLTGSQGASVSVNAFPSGTTFTDAIDTTFGNGCAPGRSQNDSVVCFTPTKGCTIRARVNVGSEIGSINLFNKCSAKPVSCLDDSTSSGSIGVEEFLIPNVEACIVVSGIDPPANASLTIEGLNNCGTLSGSSTPSLSASFSYKPTFPKTGKKVQFKDTSTGSPTGWEWDFGDGAKTTSTEQNPSFTFNNPGSYTVKLTAKKGDDENTKEKVVKVGGATSGPNLSNTYFVPSAAHTKGAEKSFWVTDFDVNNSGSGDAECKIVWLPQDTDNSSAKESDAFTVKPGESKVFKDVLKSVFNLNQAVGAVAVISDSNDLMIQSVTYNRTEDGNNGTGLPGIADFDLNPAQTKMRILFMNENKNFRSNIAFQNGTDSKLVVKWKRFKSDGTEIDSGETELEPLGNTQLNRVFKDQKPIEAAYVDVWTETPNGKFVAYGMVIDNRTNDGFIVEPQW